MTYITGIGEIPEEIEYQAREIGFIRGLWDVYPNHVVQWLYKRYKDEMLFLEDDGWAVLMNTNAMGMCYTERLYFVQHPSKWDWDLAWNVCALISDFKVVQDIPPLPWTYDQHAKLIEDKVRIHLTALTEIPKSYYKFSRWGKRRLKAIQLCGLEEEIQELSRRNLLLSTGREKELTNDAERWTTPGERDKINRSNARLAKHVKQINEKALQVAP